MNPSDGQSEKPAKAVPKKRGPAKGHRSHGRGSLVIDRVVKGVGRLRISSGTTHVPTYRRLNEMIDGLVERGRLDLIRAMQSRALTPLQVWDAYRVGELDRLPSVEMLVPLVATFERFAKEYECGDKHRVALRGASKHIATSAPTGATVAQLADTIKALRVSMKETPRAFNVVRSAAQSFARSQYGKSSKLWMAITAVELLKARPVRVKHPATVGELVTLTGAMATEMQRDLATVAVDFSGMAWTLALTGMRTEAEYFARQYAMKLGYIEVGTAKKDGAIRRLPLIRPLVDPQCWYGAFRKELHRVSDGQMTPYDLRRTYANWMEAADIPRTRRMLYLGHGALDITGRYEWHDVKAFLAEDAAKLRTWLDSEIAAAQATPAIPSLTLAK